MTNDELEAVRARAENDDGWHDVVDDAFVLLDEVERLRSDVTDLMQAASGEATKAARAEAHAERWSWLLTRALREIRSQSCDGIIYDETLEDNIEQALSAYNQRTET